MDDISTECKKNTKLLWLLGRYRTGSCKCAEWKSMRRKNGLSALWIHAYSTMKEGVQKKHPGLKVTSQQICQMWSASGIASCMTLENRNITSKKSSNCFHLHPHFCDENEWHTGHTECSLQQLEDWPHLKRSGLWIIWGHLSPEAKAPEKLRGPDWSFVDETHSAWTDPAWPMADLA